MSRRASPELGHRTTAEADYQVGYGKPPVGRRFQSGVSGNPAGRPRKDRTEPQLSSQVTPTDQLWLDEAAAPVKVRQDGQIRTLRAQQAVILSLRNKALGGGIMAQRTYIASIAEAQRTARNQRFEDFTGLFEVKQALRKELDRRLQLKLPTDDLLPHPDDILIDPRSGWACCIGPLDATERDAYKPTLELRDYFEQGVSRAARAYETASARRRAKALAEWHRAQRQFDKLNDEVPPSLQRELADRSRAPGASRAGEFAQWTPEAVQELGKQGKRRRKRTME